MVSLVSSVVSRCPELWCLVIGFCVEYLWCRQQCLVSLYDLVSAVSHVSVPLDLVPYTVTDSSVSAWHMASAVSLSLVSRGTYTAEALCSVVGHLELYKPIEGWRHAHLKIFENKINALDSQ